MTKILIRINDNWADEISVSGFMTSTKEDLDAFLLKVKKWFLENPNEPITYSIGTNEEIEHYSFDSVKRCIKFEEITDEEFNIIEKLFGGYHGFCDLLEIEYI